MRATLAIEIRVQDANFRDAIDWQVVSPGRAPNGFRRKRVVRAEGLFSVIAHIRVNPGNAVFLVNKHDLPAHLCTFLVNRNLQTFRKATFNDVARHNIPSSSSANVQLAQEGTKTAPVANRELSL